jgi:hypothetical protein
MGVLPFMGTTLINNIITKYTAQKRDADYVGYTCRHLHQRIDEYKSSVVGEHMVEQHGEDAKNCSEKISRCWENVGESSSVSSMKCYLLKILKGYGNIFFYYFIVKNF